ncbi:MAG: hypothetical protein RR356_03580 [Bacteroidales bacterium]
MAQKIPIKKFSLRLIIFSIVMAALTVAMQLIFPQYASPALPFIVLFFFLISLFTLYIVLREPHQKEARKFVSSYMLSRIIKFFSCLLFLVLYLLFNPSDRIPFAISFVIIYFAFSIFEVIILKKESFK